MLMKLLWWLARPIVTGIVNLLPDAPDPVDVVLPWPSAVPFGPFAAVLAAVFLVGIATLGLRFIRWIYGLIPVVQ